MLSIHDEENALKPKMKRKLHAKIGRPNHDGKISIDKSQEDIAAGSRVTRIKLAGRGDKGMKFSLERVTKTKREEGIREQGRESDELVTKLRIKNTKKDESDEKGGECRSRKGRFETKGAAETMACNLEPLE